MQEVLTAIPWWGYAAIGVGGYALFIWWWMHRTAV